MMESETSHIDLVACSPKHAGTPEFVQGGEPGVEAMVTLPWLLKTKSVGLLKTHGFVVHYSC